jgi:hypothetical protein
MLVGNPAQPGLLKKSIVRKNPSWCSFRVGYLDDWVYKQRYLEKYPEPGIAPNQTNMKLSTYAALLTVNFKNQIDFYGIVGSSRMQLDREFFTKRALGWGVGGKLILYKHQNFFIGTDVKYFQTDQKPRYIVFEGDPYNIVSDFRLHYEELQASLGISYRAWIFAPYINATYIDNEIDPKPTIFLVRMPDENVITDIPTGTITGAKKWGMALGLTLVDCQKASLSFEWRAFNQNAIDVNGEIRF